MGRNSAVQVLQRTQALADSQAALKEMCPALRQKFKQLQVDIVTQTQQTILFLHNLGTQALDVKEHPDEYLTEKQKNQGVDPMELIRRACSSGTGFETLKKAMQFATTYDKAGVQRLLGYRAKAQDDFRILWGHIIYLISVEDDVNRLRFEREIVDNLWTPAELHASIVRFYNGPRSSGGRKLGIPKTVAKQLEQIKEMSRIWVRRHTDVWHGREFNVYSNVMQQADSDITPETMAQLADLETGLTEMQRAVDEEMKACLRTKEYIQTVLDKRATGADEAPKVAVNAPKSTVAAKRAASRGAGGKKSAPAG